MPQRKRGQKRETHHDPNRDDDQRCQITARRALLPEQKQQRQRQQAHNAGAGSGQEHGVETRYRKACRGRDPLNITTPVSPFSQPLVVLSMIVSCLLPFLIRNGWQEQRQYDTISINCYGLKSSTVRDGCGREGHGRHTYRKGDGEYPPAHHLAQPCSGCSPAIRAGAGKDHAAFHVHHCRGL